MLLTILALVFAALALFAVFKMDSALQGILFVVAIAIVCGILYLFVLFPGFSGLSVALILASFIYRQSKK